MHVRTARAGSQSWQVDRIGAQARCRQASGRSPRLMRRRSIQSRLLLLWLLLAAAVWVPLQAHADLLGTVHRLRHKECGSVTGDLPRLRPSTGLDQVARTWSKGGRLAEAVEQTRYRGNQLASMQVQGTAQDANIAAALRDSYCNILTDARYSEIGMFRRGQGVWIVVAAPVSLPSTSQTAAFQSRLLELVNAARSRERKCGSTLFPAAPPVKASAQLNSAALAHARDMAEHDFFEHQGTDGSSPGVRATRAGYRWATVAENIAAGVTTPEQAVEGWLASPGHCSNIMQARYTEMGAAYALDPDSRPGIYWAQVFARPR
jgi:uncharacterized protein YkwD